MSVFFLSNLKRFWIGKVLVSFLVAVSVFVAPLGITISYIQDITPAKNVILLIGDGMGENHLEKTKDELSVSLVMDTMPVQGYQRTQSMSSYVTDSAAGGTALACGIRTFNGAIGCLGVAEDEVLNLDWNIVSYKSVTELAMEKGMRAGIVTSDSNCGATPASFSAHTSSRNNDEDIAEQQLASGIDLIWTASCGLVNETNCAQAGYTFVDNRDELYALDDGEKSFAQFTGMIQYDDGKENAMPLSELTTQAIKQLDNEDGFFLMVEGAHIDKYSHSNIDDEMMQSVVEFDKAIAAAIEFAKADGNTVVIVTADHETGAIKYNSRTDKYEFNSGSHSGVPVPLRIYGYDNFINNGDTILNIEVADFISKLLGYEDKVFPVMF